MIAKITPFTPNGCITAPPSKSVAHRLIILAALKNGRTEIYGVGKSDDVIATLNCVKNLGAKVEIFDDFVAIEGIKDVLVASKLPCNESGSTLRFMIPVSCALGANATFLGTEKLLSRPNEKLFDLLLAKGIKINGYNFEGKLSAGKYEIDSTISSQYITGLLLALPNLEGDSQIVLKGETVSKDYINITLSTMDLAQIKYKKTADSFIVYGNQKSNLPDKITVEGDWSGAAFPLVLGAIKGEITVKNLSLNSKQGDRKILQLLTDIGANVKIKGEQITVKESKLSAFEIDCQDIPDLAPIICVLASATNGECKIKNVERLKFKESDRIQTTLDFLQKAGITASYKEGNITVYGNGAKFKNAIYNGSNDHRVVMCQSVISAIASGESQINGCQAINKSYVSFFEDLKKLGGNIDVQMERG